MISEKYRASNSQRRLWQDFGQGNPLALAPAASLPLQLITDHVIVSHTYDDSRSQRDPTLQNLKPQTLSASGREEEFVGERGFEVIVAHKCLTNNLGLFVTDQAQSTT